ncbi:MAG: RNA-directed DNA polymerase, partial [Bacteroidetes bacterium]|nr:RNA-directed DNA polymerase [Bacteroidota bacterium]
MTKHTRSPRLVWISEEAVLIQAWKKASRYIRYHNSFADTLALDHVTANLPEFITNIQERIKSSDQWKNDPLRIVPAPKSQDWQVTSDRWERIPKDKSERSTKKKTDIHLRPLAHLSLEDQVIATAIMLYIADWVESKMGDPREEINKRKKRKKVVAYGNRLFCDKRDGGLSHRWGSTKLYRSYFQDYRKFLSRPKKVAELYSNKKKKRDIYIIEADLSKFYDRVTPDLLSESLKKIKYVNDDPDFYAFIQSIFDWQWDPRDHEFVKVYQENAGINDFSRVALPQGLVVSGFMANFVLLDFDDTLKSKIGKKICDDIRLLDVCRYVDDLRVV